MVCGLIVAVFTSTFLKKKEERTRIAGVIVEKRINSEQEILHYLEHELFKEELCSDNNIGPSVQTELLRAYGLPNPYGERIQYARIFLSFDKFDDFFHEFEDKIMIHKLWLDNKVRAHLVFMQVYFAFFNTIPILVNRIPLPDGKELTEQESKKLCDKVLFLLGASCDAEINKFMSKLDELIVNSVYKLDLKRPKKSMMRDNMYNVDMSKCFRRFEKTILGEYENNIFTLIMDLVYSAKGINPDKMSKKEYEEFLKTTDSELYNEMQGEIENFKEVIKQIANEYGAELVHKDDLDKYPDGYALPLKDVLTGKAKPKKVKK